MSELRATTTNVPKEKFQSIAKPSHIRGYSFKQSLNTGLKIGLLIHVLFIPLFYALDILELVALNIASVAIYLFALRSLKHNQITRAIRLTWFEIISHVVAAIILLGWESGFQFYLILLVSYIMINTTRSAKNRILVTLLLCLIYLGLDFATQHFTPIRSIDPEVLYGLRCMNMVIFFLSYIRIAYLYSKAIDRANASLHAMATTDPLTDLSNRRHLLDQADSEVHRSRRSGKMFAIIIGDIDDFKCINDQHGHEMGDRVLVRIAKHFKSLLRIQDVAARWGGEEFLALLPDTDLKGAQALAERIRSTISDNPLRLDGKTDIRLSMTIGVSIYRQDENIHHCISRADQAMYRGKKAGKNRVETAQ